MPLTAEEFAEFARLVGHAVLQIQELEEILAVNLVIVHKTDAKAALRDVETMFANASKQTLGQLFRASDLLSRLEHFCGRAELADSPKSS
jgi:hypothetical protein